MSDSIQDNKSFSSSVIFSFILITILISIVFFFNESNLKNIEKSEYDYRMSVISSVIETKFDNDPILEKTNLNSNVKGEQLVLYPIRNGDNISAVVIKVGNHKGYGGYIEILVGFQMDGTISGYRVITHNETIGLGSKISEEKFSEQFKHLHPNRINFKIDKDGGDIDAVSSATISSRAVVDAISSAYKGYQRFIAGE